MKNLRNLTQSSLRNHPINRRMQGFSFRIFEDEDGVQDVNFSFSFNQILILSIHWKRKWVKNALEQTARDLELYTRSNLDLIANRSSRREEQFKKNEMIFGPSDQASSRWTVAILRLLDESLSHLICRISIVRS